MTYFVDGGHMGIRAASAAEMRELDRRTVDEFGIPTLVLMENAGLRAADEAVKMLPSGSATGANVVLLCGPGNNGGDGFVVARHLYNKGANAKVLLAAKIEKVLLKADAAGSNLEMILNMGLSVREVLDTDAAEQAAPDLSSADLIVDALLGTGLSGEVREPVLTLIKLVNESRRPVLAIDIPSGLCSDTGRVLGASVKATKTVTFALPKKGFFTGAGPSHCGEIVTVDISIPRQLLS
jgi:NAD(P)H-hydrate epimerase